MLTSLLFFVLCFAVLATLVWTGTQLLKPHEDPLGDRLSELQNSAMVGGVRERIRGRGMAGRLVNVIGSIPGGDDWVRGSQKRLRQAGYRSEEALGTYMMLAVLFLFLCVGGMLFLQRNNDPSNLLGAMVAAGILGFMIPQFVLGKLATRYRKRLQDALPDTIDLLGIVLGTGLALDQAMNRVGDELQHIYPELASEFYTVTMQVRAGQERSKAFNAMVKRTGVEDIRSLSAMIIQSERFGTSLSQALAVYASEMRKKRQLRAEEAVAKAGTKMLFPIILFILPVLFVITLVPAVIKTMQDMQILGRGTSGF
jgi:tight adherence protein C